MKWRNSMHPTHRFVRRFENQQNHLCDAFHSVHRLFRGAMARFVAAFVCVDKRRRIKQDVTKLTRSHIRRPVCAFVTPNSICRWAIIYFYINICICFRKELFWDLQIDREGRNNRPKCGISSSINVMNWILNPRFSRSWINSLRVSFAQSIILWERDPAHLLGNFHWRRNVFG